MPNWIEQYGEAAKKEAERKKKQVEANRDVAASIIANGPALFEALHNAVEKDVSDFNEYFHNAQKNLSIESIGSARFQVCRKYPPDFLLNVKLAGNQIGITWEIVQNGLQRSDVFQIQHNGNGGELSYHGGTITLEQASRIIIEPAFEGIV